jgi:hypothetical protein
MEKKQKQHRRKTPARVVRIDVTPPGASFDTDEGRAAHGMRKDLGGDPSEPAGENQHTDADAPPPRSDD